jgi:N-acetylglucosamine-6-phosphate deacetylase
MAEYTVIQNGFVCTPTQVIEDGVVVFGDKRILAVGRRDEALNNFSHPVQTIDAGGDLICPGFIDQHLHGSGGADTMDQSYNAICTIAKAQAAFGVTAFCPTTMAAPDDEIEKALEAVATAVENGTGGAKVLGSHVEGSCISSEARGAHFDEYVKQTPPTIERLNSYYQASRKTIKVWTIAPELPGAIDFIQAACKLGIKVSVGHTKATYNEVNNAIEAGATGATHLYNAMAGFHYREAGATMAILNSKGRVMAEIIVDGAHVHPAAVYTALQTMGSANIVLITDCMRPAGLSSMTSFELPGIQVLVKEGQAVTADGKLCGSLLTMNRAIKNVNQMLGRSLPEAITLATINPARSLGIANKKGSLEVGKDADIVICDTFLRVRRTIVEGSTVYIDN